MNKMNILKYFSLSLILAAAIVFTGCSKSDDSNDKVELSDYAKNIVGTWETEGLTFSLADKQTSMNFNIEVKPNAISGSKIFVNGQEFDEKMLKGLGFKLSADDFPVQRLQFDKDHKVTSYEYDDGWKANDEKSTYDIKNGVLTITSSESTSLKILSMEQNSCIFDASVLLEGMMKDYKLTEKFDVKSAQLKIMKIS